MCTMSWRRLDGGWDVFFNRDESVARAPARPPAQHRVRRMDCLFAVDGEAGGTWMGVNRTGLILALVNRYPDSPGAPSTGAVSRGKLVRSLLASRDSEDVMQSLMSARWSDYAPFQLYVFMPGELAQEWVWEADAPTYGVYEEESVPVITSAVRQAEVFASRSAVFAQLQAAHGPGTEAAHLAFHRSHAPERGPLSVCMHRDDARTLSFNRITVQGDDIAYTYSPGAPCEVPEERWLTVRLDPHPTSASA